MVLHLKKKDIGGKKLLGKFGWKVSFFFFCKALCQGLQEEKMKVNLPVWGLVEIICGNGDLFSHWRTKLIHTRPSKAPPWQQNNFSDCQKYRHPWARKFLLCVSSYSMTSGVAACLQICLQPHQPAPSHLIDQIAFKNYSYFFFQAFCPNWKVGFASKSPLLPSARDCDSVTFSRVLLAYVRLMARHSHHGLLWGSHDSRDWGVYLQWKNQF